MSGFATVNTLSYSEYYQVCPQTVKSETRDNISSQRKLKRQTKFLGSSENVLNQKETSPLSVTPVFQQSPEENPDQRPRYLNISPVIKTVDKSPPDKHSSSKRNKQPSSVSIRKVVATSKFIGAAHRAKKQLRMQSRFQPGTFRYREEGGGDNSVSPSGSSPNSDSDSRHKTKRKVNFLDLVSPSHSRDVHVRDHARSSYPREPHAHQKSRINPRGHNIASPNSAFQWFPRPHVTGGSDHVSSGRHDDRSGTDVEELCQEYERLEKTRYAEMLKKAKSFRRENLPFLNRKHDS